MSMRVFCIDGGGILGVIPAMILAEIEARTGVLAGELCDLVAGTSTGGIIACAVAAGIPAARVADLYRRRGPSIFARNLGHRVATGFGLWGPQYGASGLERALADVFGDRKLSDCSTALLVPAYGIEARTPILFKSVKAADPRRNYFLRDVARATSAAPTYFPPARVASLTGEPVTAVDGGLFANNPAACALVQAVKTAPSSGSMTMVSLGTGSREAPYLYDRARRWGLARWVRPLLDCMFDGQSDTSAHQCRTLLGDRRFFRLQPALARDIAMDDASPEAIETLEAVARGLIAEQDELIDTICEVMTTPKAA